MPKVLVLESFVGSKEECEKYANAHGVIPWEQPSPFSRRKGRQNVIELAPQRAAELEKEGIVKILTDKEYAALKNQAPVFDNAPKSDTVIKPAPTPVDK